LQEKHVPLEASNCRLNPGLSHQNRLKVNNWDAKVTKKRNLSA